MLSSIQVDQNANLSKARNQNTTVKESSFERISDVTSRVSKQAIQNDRDLKLSSFAVMDRQVYVTNLQLAEKNLKLIGKELFELKALLRQSLQKLDNQKLNDLNTLIRQKQNTISKLKNQLDLDGNPILDADMKLSMRESSKSFIIPNFNLSKLENVSEKIAIEIQNLGSIYLNLMKENNTENVVKTLNLFLAPYNFTSTIGKNGDIIFNSFGSYPQQDIKLAAIKGEGILYPNDKPELVSLKPFPSSIDNFDLDVSQRARMQDFMLGLDTTIRQIQASLIDIRQKQKESAAMINQVNQNLQVKSISQQKPSFDFSYRSILAQANLHRNTVVALLKTT